MKRILRHEADEAPALSSYFALAMGLFLVVALLKWANVPIIEEPGSLMPVPADIWDLIFSSWPIRWAYWVIFPVGALGLAAFALSPPIAATARPKFH
jgi:hypothetical protein